MSLLPLKSLVFSLLIVVGYFLHEGPAKESKPEIDLEDFIAEEQIELPSFHEELEQYRPWEDEVKSEGNQYRAILDPRHKTKLYAEVTVPVLKIYKKMGDSFKAGEVLIQLDDRVFISNYRKAVSELDKSRARLDAITQLHRDGIASDFELKTVEAEYATAQSDLALAHKQLSDTSIRGPFDGKVERVNIEEHELPLDDVELIEVVDDHSLVAKFLVSSELLSVLKVGKPVVIQIQETGDSIIANISRIGAMIDPSSSTIKVEVEIDNSEGQYKAGMIAVVTLKKNGSGHDNGR